MLWTFVPIAALVTVTPGPATALVVRSALRGGVRTALATIAGNSIGVMTWGILSVLGISALVAASEAAFIALKAVGACVLVVLGVQSILRARRGDSAGEAKPGRRAAGESRSALRDGLVSGFANPKLAVFFVALFPQFVPEGGSVLPATLLMAVMIVIFDLVWFSALATMVARAKRGVIDSGLAAGLERVTGAVLIALGLRLALEPR
jgi:threonine/homoserine/homoserine lactone efflux protein